MQSEIEKDKRIAIATLKSGISENCADNITEILINLETGTCDYMELIPVLEEVARVDTFYYFDDNGAGGMPHADIRRKSSFKSWALTAIKNIRENAALDSSTLTHRVLKSNITRLIKSTLEGLKKDGRTADKTLLPILEKIIKKDLYNKYSYLGGFEKDCFLGELARTVFDMIIRNSTTLDNPNNPDSRSDNFPQRCAVCSALPDDLTVNTGREEYFPDAFNKLVGIDDEYRAEFRYCPACRIYFNWIDMPQMYGSGNNDEERLVRLSPEKSRLLDKLFTADERYRPTKVEVETFFATLPLDLLVLALRHHLYKNRELISHFIPQLVGLLGKNNDTSLWEFLRAYVSDSPERAEEIIDTFRSSNEYPPNRLIQILHQCLRIVKGK